MPELNRSKNAPRSLRAAAAVRGNLLAENRRRTVWRRTEMGTNHIACFGVWRTGSRRQAKRLGRAGQTRWHMPHRDGAAMALSGAACETAGEN